MRPRSHASARHVFSALSRCEPPIASQADSSLC